MLQSNPHDHLHPAHRSLSLSLERQDLSCMYLAHHELESIIIITIIITSIIIVIIIIVFTINIVFTLYTGVCHPSQGTAAAANKSQHVCQRT